MVSMVEKVLVVDDDIMICETLANVFTELQYHTKCVHTLKEGMEAVQADDYDVVFLDVRLPDGNSLSKLSVFNNAPSRPEVIIITAFAETNGAEIAIKAGVWDYLKKPAGINTIKLTLKRAVQYRREKRVSKPSLNIKRHGIIGNSHQINQCLDLVARNSQSDVNILIYGETGTGKELFARAIHANSERSKMNFVPVDCGSLPESLIESLLFGHAKGAFTGADKAKDGLVKHADRGTLFLDEIGELSMELQKVFLRFIQERRFHNIGGVREIKSDFRLIAATNRNLEEMVQQNGFREDLFYRIRSVLIHLPPLRHRKDDLKELTIHYIKTICDSYQTGMKGFSPEFFEQLTAYSWPGNVRELFSALEVAVANARYEPTLFPQHLPGYIRVKLLEPAIAPPEELFKEGSAKEMDNDSLPKWKAFRGEYIARGEKEYLEKLIRISGANIKKAVEISGLSQPRLYELLRKCNLSLK
jgi:two-component system NtrC family response regulator